MELTYREQMYLNRYLAGTMTIDNFTIYVDKGYISQEFYNYILSLEK